MFQIGMNLLCFIYLYNDTFKLGMSFIYFIQYVAEISNDYAVGVWEHQMFHFIVSFIIWAIDHFQIASFEITTTFDETEMYLISPEFQNSLIIVEPPKYQFITNKTFPSHLVINKDPLNDKLQLIQYEKSGFFDIISSQPNLKEIIDALQNLAKLYSSEFFLSSFTDVSLKYAKSYLIQNKDLTF